MRLKWLALTFLLGFIVILDPTLTPAQPQPGGGGKGGMKGGGNKRGEFGGGGFNKDGTAGAPGGGGPGGFQGGNGGGGFPGGGRGPGGGGPGSGPGGGMRGMMTPDAAWAQMLSRASLPPESVSIDLNQLPSQTRDFLMGSLQRGNVQVPSNGILTKEMYVAARMEAGQRGPGGPGGPGSPMVFVLPGQNRGPGGEGNPDGNGNNEKGTGEKSRDRKNDKKDAEEEKPSGPLRYGKLPKDLPSWFEENDINKDGQVELWEWLKAGKSIAEFNEMDLNEDNIITADEYLRWVQQQTEAAKILVIESGERPKPVAQKQKGSKSGTPAVAEGDAVDAGDAEKSDTEKSDKDTADKDTADKDKDKDKDKVPPKGKGSGGMGTGNAGPWQNGGRTGEEKSQPKRQPRN